MRKLITITLLIIFLSQITGYSTGDGNIDGGGGAIGSGSGSNYWNPGDDGVRVTIICESDNAAVTTPIDLTNIVPESSVIHFGKYSKLNYRNGKSLVPQVGNYYCKRPIEIMPRIISSSSNKASIDSIKRYFCSENVIMVIANESGFDYNSLIDGNYKILIEPLAYFVFNGLNYAMTAHEAALYDQQLNGGLRSKMASLTHKNLPFAIFLERADLGYPAWSGATNVNVSNSQIISSLGLGIVKFTESDLLPDTETSDYEYRSDTDVITSLNINTTREINPDNPLSVSFVVDGRTYIVRDIVIPKDESQLVWVKWRTPAIPQTCPIKVYVAGNIYKNITAKIVQLIENEPPDPKANDRNDSFERPNLPNNPQVISSSWGVWWSKWHINWEWESKWTWTGAHWWDNGKWVDNGWWDFYWNNYSASLSATKTITPDSKVPTAYGQTMKSGYGFNINVSTNISTNAPGNSVTPVQNAVSYFPEFKYEDYWRVLQKTISGNNSIFQFKNNKYSTYNKQVHFTPLWYPDGNYIPYTKVFDCWTPVGMLYVNLTDTLNISGSLYDDWHIGPKK